MARHAIAAAVAATVFGSGPLDAQFTDLQPGRNFPTVNATLGGDSTEDIELGDVDGDGDLDALVVNSGTSQLNRMFINNGGAQGGTEGAFTDETSARLMSIASDMSFDGEFVDFENDGDLDIFISNRGTLFGGAVSRFFINDGQGIFTEETDTRWGTLVSVPLEEQVFGGNAGPWGDWSCDCDFGDLDDDGDLDLFQSSYGPSFQATTDSRVFLNDGSGVFHELWPWVDTGAEISLPTVDVDLADLDGDLDLDIVMAGRSEQARVFINNVNAPLAGSVQMFTDTTQRSLLDQGAVFSGPPNYVAEYGDLDDDGDFDVWMVNYSGAEDAILVNLGSDSDGIVRFQADSNRIKGVDGPFNIEFIDFDSDGDVDAFPFGFTSFPRPYVSGNSQGGAITGQFHRAGITSGGSLYSMPEGPAVSIGFGADGAAIGDVDSDGDPDVMLAIPGANQLMLNDLGVPDTHAPTFQIVRASKTIGNDRIVHVQLRDNAPNESIAHDDVVLTASVDGAAPAVVEMFSQGGQQFRGAIASAVGATCVDFTIEATDDAGNTGAFSGSLGTCGPFTNLGDALAGVSGEPSLTGTGALSAGSSNALSLSNAAPSSLAVLFVSLAENPVPFKGGTLHAVPELVTVTTATSPAGAIDLPFTWPAALPPGFEFVTQCAIQDAAAVQGVALSNAVLGTTP